MFSYWQRDAFLSQSPHEEAQIDGGKDAEHEACQGQDAGQPLHQLDKAGKRLLQTWGRIGLKKKAATPRVSINAPGLTHAPGSIGKALNIKETVFSSGKCINSEKNLKHRKNRQKKRKLKETGHKISPGLENYHSFVRGSDDCDIGPVPRVFEKGEFADAEAPGHHLYQRFQQEDGCESQPARQVVHSCFSSAIFFHVATMTETLLFWLNPAAPPTHIIRHYR